MKTFRAMARPYGMTIHPPAAHFPYGAAHFPCTIAELPEISSSRGALTGFSGGRSPPYGRRSTSATRQRRCTVPQPPHSPAQRPAPLKCGPGGRWHHGCTSMAVDCQRPDARPGHARPATRAGSGSASAVLRLAAGTRSAARRRWCSRELRERAAGAVDALRRRLPRCKQCRLVSNHDGLLLEHPGLFCQLRVT